MNTRLYARKTHTTPGTTKISGVSRSAHLSECSLQITFLCANCTACVPLERQHNFKYPTLLATERAKFGQSLLLKHHTGNYKNIRCQQISRMQFPNYILAHELYGLCTTWMTAWFQIPDATSHRASKIRAMIIAEAPRHTIATPLSDHRSISSAEKCLRNMKDHTSYWKGSKA